MAKQRRIALKLYEWVEKRPYFHKMARKKIRKKKVWSSIEPSTVKSYSSASGRFSHSGSHIIVAKMQVTPTLVSKKVLLVFGSIA